jgi:carbonic anhydrase
VGQRRLGSVQQGPLFVTCADSRVVPDLILQTQPGDLFICRNAGNVIPRAGEPAGGVSATIEYAVQVLRVRHLIVCGHSDCGVIRALMASGALEGAEQRARLAAACGAGLEVCGRGGAQCGELTRHTALTHANVLVQLDNLRTHAYIQRAIAEGRLQVHGWYYDIMSGRD